MGVRLKKIGKGGNYYVICYDGSKEPKEKSWPLKTKRKDVAMIRFGQFMEKYERGKLDPWNPAETVAKKMTVAEAVWEFLRTRRHLRERTQETYEGILNRLQKRLPPNLMVRHLTANHLEAFIYDPTVKRATQRKRYTHVRVFCKWAVRENVVEKNPLAGVGNPKDEKRLPSYLSPEDLERLITTIETDYEMKVASRRARPGSILWLRDAVLLAVSTGLRRGELLNLHWSDIDTVGGWVNVRNRRGFRTKGGDERSVPMTLPAREVLTRLRSERLERGEVADAPVLTGEGGGPLNPNLLTRRFKHYIRLAKLDDRLRLHDLRHTTAAWLSAKGVSLQIIAAILGHKGTRVTEQFYAHLQPDTLKNAMAITFGSSD